MRYIYVDESRIINSRYLLFGSLWLPRDVQKDFRQQFWQLWDKNFPSRNSELKWTKVSNNKLQVYKKFIDFFTLFYQVDFRCVVIDNHKVDYQIYHKNDKELGFYKFLFFFLSRNIEKDFRFKRIDDDYQILIDSRRRDDEFGRLTDLKKFLNNRLNQVCSKKDIVRNVESEPDSKLSPEIQIVDVLLGAIGYVWEGFQTSSPKLSLIEYIEQLFGLKLNQPTPYLSDKINIWEFQFSNNQKSALLPTPDEGLDVR